MRELKELQNAISNILEIYQEVSKDWEFDENNLYNQSTIMVKDAYENIRILLNIIDYAEFLNTKEFDKLLKLSSNGCISHTRVKQFNSIIFKLATYLEKNVNGDKGTIPINKCFNDIFGLRIVTEIEFNLKEVKTMLQENFPMLKCIDSSKGDYKAIHIYFKSDNLHYQWELQLWYKKYEDSNHKSHKKHKQAYTNWERLFKNLKGGYNG